MTSKDRKNVFEKYVKERAEEERREKRQRLKQQRDDFKLLLEEANLNSKSSFGDFADKYAKDSRFKNIEKMRDRENLFNDFISDLRKKEREEKAASREKVQVFFSNFFFLGFIPNQFLSGSCFISVLQCYYLQINVIKVIHNDSHCAAAGG